MPNLGVGPTSSIIQSGEIEDLFGSRSLKELKEEAPNSFSQVLEDSINKVNLDQKEADTAIKNLIAGRSKNIHETLLTVERADTSLKLMMQVRNKILDAYREIMRMQV